MRSRIAFTLVELLVVIAIIAIVAALVFAAFNHVRLAAHRTTCLSNNRQIGTAMAMYIEDYDETTPSAFLFTDGSQVDVFMALQPYIKNHQVFYCPDRFDEADICAFMVPANYPANSRRCLGYGYNWGFLPFAGGGLVADTIFAADGTVVEPGISIAQIDKTAEVAAFADTYNEPPYTMSAVESIIDSRVLGPDIKTNSVLRHGGFFNVNFVDGHAKAIAFKGGTIIGFHYYIGLPKDDSLRSMFCSSADAIVNTSNPALPVTLPYGSIPCSAALTLPEQVGVQWWTD